MLLYIYGGVVDIEVVGEPVLKQGCDVINAELYS